MQKQALILALFCYALLNCNSRTSEGEKVTTKANSDNTVERVLQYDTTIQAIHIFVALCDNKYQGIVPVPAAIGNGQDPDNNLYWGCGFGIRTYFKKSSEW